jgi:hypothetical protein
MGNIALIKIEIEDNSIRDQLAVGVKWLVHKLQLFKVSNVACLAACS